MNNKHEVNRDDGRIIVAISGGKASAWCANWAIKKFGHSKVVLYFNDTKWEHSDLYRFLRDLEKYLDHEIIFDSDGRSPEELFADQRALANNLMPFCSRILKAERLKNYYCDGDIICFGIGKDEIHRAKRIVGVYQVVAAKTGKFCTLRFPLIEEDVCANTIDCFIKDTGIETPELYKLGFKHNNCSGGCVRAGKKQWKLLYDKLPDVYAERERVENQMRKMLGKDIHFLKDETLESFRHRIETGALSSYYDGDDDLTTDCIGICNTMN